jgi:hypothetical protein
VTKQLDMFGTPEPQPKPKPKPKPAPLDTSGGDAARDEALDSAADHAADDGWWDEACDMVKVLRDWSGTGEDLRLRLRRFIGDPPSQGAWGALTANAIKNGWIERTGERRKMRVKESHSRMTDVYRTKP